MYCLIPDDGGLADPAGVNAMATAARAVTTTASRRRRDGRPSRLNRSSFISFLPQIDAISHIWSAEPVRVPSVGRNLQVRIYNDGARRRFGPRSTARAEPFAGAFAPAEPETVLRAGKPWLMHPSSRSDLLRIRISFRVARRSANQPVGASCRSVARRTARQASRLPRRLSYSREIRSPEEHPEDRAHPHHQEERDQRADKESQDHALP